MVGNPDWWRSFFFLWGPWLFVLALAALATFALTLFVRSALRRRGVTLAAGWLIGAVLCGLFAFVDVIALSIALGRESLGARTAIVLGALLIVSLLGLLGCGAYAIWRIIETKPAT